MRILVWGAYQQGNLGDGMMAWAVFDRGCGLSVVPSRCRLQFDCKPRSEYA